MAERNEYSGPFMGRVQTRIRMDKSLYEQLERSAQESGRSVNSEVVCRLEQSFDQSSKVELLQSALEKSDARIDALMDLIVKMVRPGQMSEEAGIRLDMPRRSREEDK